MKMDEKGERRIPLTICDYDREAGTVTIVFQTVGASTHKDGGIKGRRCVSVILPGRWDVPSEFVGEDIESTEEEENAICSRRSWGSSGLSSG